MANDILAIRAWVRRAKRVATATQKKLSEVLDDINDAILGGGIQDGQVVVSCSEGGGSSSFAMMPGLTPIELASLNEQAIAWCNSFNDPENPVLNARRITRMRVSFSKGVPC